MRETGFRNERRNSMEVNIQPAIQAFSMLNVKREQIMASLKMSVVTSEGDLMSVVRSEGDLESMADEAIQGELNRAWELVNSTFEQCVRNDDAEGYIRLQAAIAEHQWQLMVVDPFKELDEWKAFSLGFSGMEVVVKNITEPQPQKCYEENQMPTQTGDSDEDGDIPLGIMVRDNTLPSFLATQFGEFRDPENEELVAVSLKNPNIPTEFYASLILAANKIISEAYAAIQKE